MVAEVGGGGQRKHEGVHRSMTGKAMEGRAHRSGPASGRWHMGGSAAASDVGGLRRWPTATPR
jgi:hypothetical protein